MKKTLDKVGLAIKDLPSAKERADHKATAIAKLGAQKRRAVGVFDIEITSIEKIDGGVAVFARAWAGADGFGPASPGEQIGFGVDGSVDVERFRIFNPPILVPDGTKSENVGEYGVVSKIDNFREDLLEALFLTLSHTIKVTAKHGAARIVEGKIGNTTSTFYPDASPESTSVDGFAAEDYASSTALTWATIRGNAGNFSQDAGNNANNIGFSGSTTTDRWCGLRRGIFLFDTSAIPDTDEVTSATMSLYGNTKSDGHSASPDINVYTSTPASNTAVVNADYAQLGSTAKSTAITYANWSTTGYNDFVLNDLTVIAKTGVTKLGVRNANYDVANSAPPWVSGAFSGLNSYHAEQTGTSNDPKLVVTHAVPATGQKNMMLMGVG